MRAAIYARVSTSKQEQEETIASQVAALREAALARGLVIPPEQEFLDDGYSGATVERPALERLRDLAAEGGIAVLLVAAPDRLARQYAYQVVILEELQQAGCEVVFLNHGFGQSPAEQMLLQMQGVFAEYERALIRERTRRGRLFAARAGRVNWGRAPYGYRLIRKTDHTPQQLAVDEAEAEVVRTVYRWLVEEALPTAAIARRLNAQGIPSRSGRVQGWWQSTVLALLRAPCYKGEAVYNRTARADAQRPYGAKGYKDRRPGNQQGSMQRPQEEWIPVRVPALVPSDTWDLAQAQLAANRQQASRNNHRHPYLLRGLLICGACGRRLVGAWRSGQPRYECSARYPRGTPWSCHSYSQRADRLETQVWAYVRSLLADPALLRARYHEGRGDPALDPQQEQEQRRLDRQLTGLEREARRLLDAYQASVIELTELQERRQHLTEHGAMLRQRRAELERLRTDREQELRLLEGADAFCQSIQAALDHPSFAIQQQVLQLVVDRVVVEDQQLTVHHVVPAGPFRLQTDHPNNPKPAEAGWRRGGASVGSTPACFSRLGLLARPF
ncbi:MAG TPA: recombinase family protein [Terriglobales bacterium]|nr:recombinase family protein [Terriglobales bacterium]